MFRNLLGYLTLDQNFTVYRQAEYARRLMLLYWISIIGALAILPFGIGAYLQGCRWLGLFDILVAVTLIVNAVVTRQSKLLRANIWVGTLCVMGLFNYTFITGGINQSGFIWCFILPPLVSFLLGSKPGLTVSLLMLVPALALSLFDWHSPLVASYSTDIAIRFPISYLIVVYFSYLFERDHERHCDTQGKLHEELEKRVADRTRALTLANAKLAKEMNERQQLQSRMIRAEKLEAVGNLVGGVAHDLNNILSGLVTYPDVILATLPKDSSVYQPMLTIKKSGERAAAIVHDMLWMARGVGTTLRPLNLSVIVAEYLSSLELQELMKHHPGVELDSDLAADLRSIDGTDGLLSKIVMNLVTNAVEATAAGGQVRVTTGNCSLRATVNGYDHIEPGEYVTLMVSDSGSGISAKDMARIFEPFFTRKTLGRSGTGLGLAVVWRGVKELHGFIDVESQEDQGTIFSLYFPVARSVPDQEMTLRADLQGRGEIILVVDDVAEQRDMAKSIFETLGYSVLTAANGPEALNQVRLTMVDLVMLDMVLDTGMDGLDTYRELLKVHPGQKAIIVSGFEVSDRVREMQRLGAGPFIQKPYVFETIAAAVRSELDGRVQDAEASLPESGRPSRRDLQKRRRYGHGKVD